MEDKLDNILAKFSELESRISIIESTRVPASQLNREPAHQPADTDINVDLDQQTSNSQGQARVAVNEDSSRPTVSPQIPNDIGRQFDAIRDKVSRIPIPDNFKLNESPVGIKQELKPSLKIISKTARHSETGLKLLREITSPDNETDDGSFYLTASQAQDLFTVFASQSIFLQSEYTSLVVKSTFNAETSRIFRSFENNSSAFTESSLRNVRIAAELSAISERQVSTSRGGPRGYRGSRLFRGARRGHTFQRGNWGNFATNDIPPRPQSEDQI